MLKVRAYSDLYLARHSKTRSKPNAALLYFCTGSLFVAKRSSSPRFKMIVMNRNSKDNLEVPLSSTFQMQVREPYLIFRSEKSETKIKGIWFHDGKERQSIVEILNRAVKSLSAKDNSTVQQNNDARQPQMNKEQAAASLMSALKIGGSSSDTGSTAQQKQVSAPSTPQQPNTQDTNVQNMVLDKKSLQLSLMSLLQEDKFLDLIHTQYLKVAKARSSGNIKK